MNSAYIIFKILLLALKNAKNACSYQIAWQKQPKQCEL